MLAGNKRIEFGVLFILTGKKKSRKNKKGEKSTIVKIIKVIAHLGSKRGEKTA